MLWSPHVPAKLPNIIEIILSSLDNRYNHIFIHILKPKDIQKRQWKWQAFNNYRGVSTKLPNRDQECSDEALRLKNGHVPFLNPAWHHFAPKMDHHNAPSSRMMLPSSCDFFVHPKNPGIYIGSKKPGSFLPQIHQPGSENHHRSFSDVLLQVIEGGPSRAHGSRTRRSCCTGAARHRADTDAAAGGLEKPQRWEVSSKKWSFDAGFMEMFNGICGNLWVDSWIKTCLEPDMLDIQKLHKKPEQQTGIKKTYWITTNIIWMPILKKKKSPKLGELHGGIKPTQNKNKSII